MAIYTYIYSFICICFIVLLHDTINHTAWHLDYIHPETLFFFYYNRIRTENLERELEQARVRASMQEEQLRRFRQQELQHSNTSLCRNYVS
jgi:hypothetical protein